MAAADNLGRVQLLDASSATVLRVFKGYRDAHCAWLSLQLPARQPPSGQRQPELAGHSAAAVEDKGRACMEGAVSEAGAAASARRVRAERQEVGSRQSGGLGRAGERLLLAVHAPKRAIIEVWEVPYGSRLCSLKVDADCCMIPVAPVFGSGQVPRNGSRTKGSQKLEPSRCWLLDCAHGGLRSLDDAVRTAVLAS